LFRIVLRICVWKVLTTLNRGLIWATTIATIRYFEHITSQLRHLLTRFITLSFQLHWFWSILVSHYRIIRAQRSGCFTWTLVREYLLVFFLQNLCFYLTCIILSPFEHMLNGFFIIVVEDILLNFLLNSFNNFLVRRFLFVL